jgi:hypothetical protein
MTAPVGLRVGWEFLKYTVRFTRLFVDFCGLSVGLKKRPQFPIPRLSAMMPLLAYVIFALLSYDIFAFGISAFSGISDARYRSLKATCLCSPTFTIALFRCLVYRCSYDTLHQGASLSNSADCHREPLGHAPTEK